MHGHPPLTLAANFCLRSRGGVAPPLLVSLFPLPSLAVLASFASYDGHLRCGGFAVCVVFVGVAVFCVCGVFLPCPWCSVCRVLGVLLMAIVMVLYSQERVCDLA